jgi:hypothetical protein
MSHIIEILGGRPETTSLEKKRYARPFMRKTQKAGHANVFQNQNKSKL